MKKHVFTLARGVLSLRVALISSATDAAPPLALLNSWFLSWQGQNAQVITAQTGGTTLGPSTTWAGQTTPSLADVQQVQVSASGDSIYMRAPLKTHLS